MLLLYYIIVVSEHSRHQLRWESDAYLVPSQGKDQTIFTSNKQNIKIMNLTKSIWFDQKVFFSSMKLLFANPLVLFRKW